MQGKLVLVMAGNRLCALPVKDVEEVMRPLPCQTLPTAPAFVRGSSIIRGTPTPIVDLRMLLGDEDQLPACRLVLVRTDAHRRVGLLVDKVIGLRNAEELQSHDLPPLLRDTAPRMVETLARLDDKLLTILRAASLVPDTLWQELSNAGERP